MKSTIEYPLAKMLLNRDAIVFCGAGISIEPPAGLPDWKKLRDFTLEAIATKHWTTQKYLSSLLTTPMIAEPGERGLTPEVVASEVVVNCQKYFECFRALNDGEPNANHLYLARLAREGFLSCIVTTNFDLFIEKALKQEGVNYKVYRTEKEFESYGKSDKVALLKLHGCISIPQTITSTVEQEARGLSVIKQKLLADLLCRYYFIFWGYSGADLKINLNYLQMVSQKECARGFFWHFFQNSSYTETVNINVKKLVNLYENRGKVIHGQLPGIFDELISNDPIKQRNYSDCERIEWQKKKNNKLKMSLFEWAEKKITVSHALTIFGNLFYLNGQLNYAGNCYLDCINVSQEEKNYSNEAATWSNIGGVYRTMGYYEEALECYAEAEKIAYEQKDKENLAIFINNIGRVHRAQGNYLKAASYYEKSVSLNSELKNYKELAIALNNTGLAHAFLNQHKRALNCYYQALSISKYLGDKRTISAQRNNLGNIYLILGNQNQALAQYIEVENICRALGDKNNLAVSLNNIGTIYKQKKHNQKATEYFENALLLAEEIEDIQNCAIFSKNLAIFYEQFSSTKAMKYYAKSQRYYSSLQETEQARYIAQLSKHLVYLKKDIEDTDNQIIIPPLDDGDITNDVIKKIIAKENIRRNANRIHPHMMANVAPRQLTSLPISRKTKTINPLLKKNPPIATHKTPIELDTIH
ncbi:tetratricopeptide repeat protein [Candidatus Uabimicrobium sp. HlEnr_7]|uniref:tetratricopeptide repeat protein n=1 Tax=Candidatus Uabimicrobium helgolandensis TaxID=3095367 RepID=UPI003555CD96